jgi:acetyl esterase
MTPKRIHPQIQTLLELGMKHGVPPVQTLSPEQARESRNPMMITNGGPPETVAHVEDRIIPGPAGGLPVRIYTPEGNAPFPILVYYHGGGWVIGNIDTHNGICAALANRADCIVVSVDYRLAPEHRFPAAADDAYGAVRYIADHAREFGGKSEKIAVGGDSAGGNLATVACLMAKDRKAPDINFQLLVYPVTDLSNTKTESYRNHADGYNLTRDGMIYFRNHYLAEESDRHHPYASPLLAPDLTGLPPAFVIAAEFDVLLDEGKAYADRLKASGNMVAYVLYDDMIHAFFNMSACVDRACEAIDQAGGALKNAFSG